MDKDCNKCVYSSRDGNCRSWDCNYKTVEDVKTEEYNRVVDFMKYHRYAIVDNDGDYFSIEELEEMLKEQTE